MSVLILATKLIINEKMLIKLGFTLAIPQFMLNIFRHDYLGTANQLEDDIRFICCFHGFITF